jgi:NADPH:quinone reductase-like Zn-dependent oxidoreductase
LIQKIHCQEMPWTRRRSISLAVQLAVVRGARVIGTASLANHEYLRSLGAEPVAYGEGLAGRVRALAPVGVDAALDVAGSGVLPAAPDSPLAAVRSVRAGPW